MHPYLTERMLQPVGRARAARRDRRAAPRAPRRLGLPARARGRRDLAPGADPRRGRRLPGDARAAALPPGAARRTRRPRSCAPRSARAASTPRPSRRCSAPPATASLRRREGPAGLTPREVEVLRLLARGLSNKEIAERLVISPKTVANHIEHIYAKIGASNRARGEPVRDAARPPPGGGVRRAALTTRSDRPCIACMFLIIVASTTRSSSLGLNCTNSLPGVGQRHVAGREVERVAGLEDLLVVGEAVGQPALEHVAPVRALAAVVGQPLEQRRPVDVLAERHEVDRVAVDVLAPLLDDAVVLDLARSPSKPSASLRSFGRCEAQPTRRRAAAS